MARFGQDSIEEVRSRADIVEIIGAHVRLKRAGRNFVGLCPFHNEKTPSFSVNPERGFFHCFGCGVGGTVFDFVMRIEALSFAEALQTLARRYGVKLPEHAGGAAGQPGEKDALIRANQLAADFFGHVLWNTPEGTLARDYLHKRGITVETARAFMIGYAPGRPANLAAALEKRGLLAPAIKLGLVRQDGNGAPFDMFRGRLMFPIRDPQARVIAFGGRVLDDRLPKYINSPESPLYSKARALYGLYEARQSVAKADRAIVVEGYVDAIVLWQAGFKETVASLGTSLTVEQLRLLSRYTRNVIACFDGDAAGRKASLRALEIFLQAGLAGGRGVFIPAGYDPDTLVRERGAAAFAELIASAQPLMDYFLREQRAAAGESVDARARAAERVAEILRIVTNAFEFDMLARKAAQIFGIREELLRQQARRGAPRGPRTAAAALPNRAAPNLRAIAEAELGLVAIALRFPELRPEILSASAPAEFADPLLSEALSQIGATDESQAVLEVEIMNRLGADERGRLSALMVGPLMGDQNKAQALMADYIRAITDDKRRRKVREELSRAASTGDALAAQSVIELRQRKASGR